VALGPGLEQFSETYSIELASSMKQDVEVFTSQITFNLDHPNQKSIFVDVTGLKLEPSEK